MPTNGSSPAIVRPLGGNGHALSPKLHKAAARLSVVPAERPPTRSVSDGNKPPSTVAAAGPEPAIGFLLLDPALNPVSFNATALQILGYPEGFADAGRIDVVLARRIRMHLVRPGCSRELPLVTEFRSGRRRYMCRAFALQSPGKGSSPATVAVLIERMPCPAVALARVCEQFGLTRREREALEHLVTGATSKQIAERMAVSPNTVKAFLRLIMVKMGVSSRSAILAQFIATP